MVERSPEEAGVVSSILTRGIMPENQKKKLKFILIGGLIFVVGWFLVIPIFLMLAGYNIIAVKKCFSSNIPCGWESKRMVIPFK